MDPFCMDSSVVWVEENLAALKFVKYFYLFKRGFKSENLPLYKVSAFQSCAQFSCGQPHISAIDHTDHIPLFLQCECSCASSCSYCSPWQQMDITNKINLSKSRVICSCASSCSSCSPWHHILQNCIQLEMVVHPQRVEPTMGIQRIFFISKIFGKSPLYACLGIWHAFHNEDRQLLELQDHALQSCAASDSTPKKVLCCRYCKSSQSFDQGVVSILLSCGRCRH